VGRESSATLGRAGAKARAEEEAYLTSFIKNLYVTVTKQCISFNRRGLPGGWEEGRAQLRVGLAGADARTEEEAYLTSFILDGRSARPSDFSSD
jgi:hypothetical protein